MNTSKKKYSKVQRVVSFLVIFVFTISTMSMVSYANNQIPVRAIYLTNVSYKTQINTSGDTIISPLISIRWTNPDSWKTDIDPAEEHEPEEYIIQVKNNTTSEYDDAVIRDGSDDFDDQGVDLQSYMTLVSGSEYDIKVIPQHYHDSEKATYESGGEPTLTVISDLQVEFEVSQDSITVIWDNINTTNNQYQIILKEGDYSDSSVTDLITNEGVTPINVNGPGFDLEEDFEESTNGEGVNSYYDPISKRHKLSYTLTGNIVPGADYTIAVLPNIEDSSVYYNENPFVHVVKTNIKLSYIENSETLQFLWNVKENYPNVVGGYKLVGASLKNITDNTEIVKFEDGHGSVGYYIIEKPNTEKEYYMTFSFEKTINGQTKTEIVASNIVTYVPSDMDIIPTKPLVMELFSEDKFDSLVKPIDQSDFEDRFLLTSYNGDYTQYSSIIDKKITFHLDENDNAINFVWGSFQRYPVDETEGDLNVELTDLNVYYDITVTDTYDALPYATKFLSNQRYGTGDTSSLIKSTQGRIEGFRATLDGYYEDETGEMKSIEAGKIYYIEIVAKKYIGDTEIESEPTRVSFYYTETGEAYAPPLIPKPPLQVENSKTTPNSVTIKWRQKWSEVIDPIAADGDALEDWATEVWVDNGVYSSEPIEGASGGGTYYKVYEGGTDLTDLLALFPQLETRTINLSSKPFNQSAIKYKFYRLEYESVLKAMEEDEISGENAFTEYFYNFVRKDDDVNNRDLINWKVIEPYLNEVNSEEVMYTEDGLAANTSYMFVIYPYRVLDSETILEAHYPTPIIVATNPEPVELNPDPMVPNLYINDIEDTSISVYWKFYEEFEYELAFSLTDQVEDATEFLFELPENKNDPEYPKDGQKNEEVITDLFPNTGYYFFIRATNSVTGTSSEWSNPVFGITEDVPIPSPPRGLGVAPEEKMVLYDYEESVTYNSIAVQWLKDPLDEKDDEDSEESNSVQIYYSYILEVANNEKFVDPIYVVSGGEDEIVPDNVELLESTLAKINELVSNRYYYFRMKTRVTVVGDKKGQYIVKESDYYSPTIRIITVPSDSEYDSGSDPALEILPSENYELIYDADEQELTYRFRDSSTDSEGSADNNVEQRLITNMIKQNLYSFDIDIANYDNKPIVKRTVIIPYSIIEAFDSYEIELKIDADKMLINIPHDALMDEVNRQKTQYGVAPSIEITIEDVDAYYDHNQMPEEALLAVSIPQEMDIKVKSMRTQSTINYTDVPIELGLSTNNRYEIYGKEPVVYSLNPERRWEEVDGNYDREEGAFMMNTKNIGSYGVFLTEGSNEIVSTKPSHWSEIYKAAIDSEYTVIGLDGYDPDRGIPENQVINICYSLIVGDETIDVDQYISSKQLSQLMYAGIKTDTTKDATTITRQEGIAMMMAMMEIRDDLKIKTDAAIMTAVNNNGSVNSLYKTAIAKAATIGLVSDINALRPNDTLTYGEFFALWAKADGDM